MSLSQETHQLEQTLMQARHMLETLRTKGETPDDDERPIQGAALGGLVRATATSGGRIERIDLDPTVKRLPVDDIAAAVTTAVNAALTEAAERTGGEAVAVDLAALSAQVHRVQDDGIQQMARFTSALNDVMTRLGGRS